MNIFRTTALAAVLLLPLSLALAEEAKTRDLTVHRTDAADWPNVRLAVEVPEADDVPAHYHLRLGSNENITAAQVTKINEQPRPASVVIAIDTSRSLSPAHLAATKDALSRYVDQLEQDEQVAVLAFDDKVQLVTGFTSDRDMFKRNLDKLQLAGNYTELYRSMLYGVELLKNIPGQRALLVVTDGKDEGTTITRENVLDAALTNNVYISGIGIPALPGEQSERYLPALRELTMMTGGMYRDAGSAQELGTAAHDLLVANAMPVTNLYEVRFDGDKIRAVSASGPVSATLVHEQNGLIQTAPVSFDAPSRGTQPAAVPATTAPAVSRVSSSVNTTPVAVTAASNSTVPATRAVLAEESTMLTHGEDRDGMPVALVEETQIRRVPLNDAPATVTAPAVNEPTPAAVTAPAAAEPAPVVVEEVTAQAVPVDVEPVALPTPLTPSTPYMAPDTHLHALWPWIVAGLLALALLWYLVRRRSEPLAIEFPELGQTFLLKPGTMIMGTGSDSQIRLDDPTAKDAHATFCVGKDCRDTRINAAQGISLNGQPVTKDTKLKAGDILKMGNTTALIKSVHKDDTYNTLQHA